ncbi:LCCL domain-containing protein [Roseicella aerolata]|uniref:OmpA family protein n=1 Tax=Roseicella aerolata TaxID=2883479 RepID=A0A9X1IF89_9PROT|nr:LCCL domain-containing protein [Roseicella aerolata]MCB4822633.1 OmpA family protein [Roseicella aerolata]
MRRAVLSLLLLLAPALPALAQGNRVGEGPPKAPAPAAQCPDDMRAYADTDAVLTCACPAELTGRGTVRGTGTYTADSATCLAAVHAGMIARGGGEVTVEMLPGQPRHPGTTRNGVTSGNAGPSQASFRFQGVPQQAAAPAPVGPTVLGQCPDNMAAFTDAGEVVTCTCPASLLGQGSVWGTDIYTADSGTCRAALHAGMVGRQGGPVTMEMLDGQPRYVGTTRNGVTSANYGSYKASFRFQGEPVARPAQPQPAAAPAQCPDDMLAYAGSDEVLACTCPASLLGRGSVWGTDIYTADSGTCRAALHAGMIGRQGGPVTVEMLEGQPRYVGTTRNGVTSANYGAYQASFRFQGEPRRRQAAGPAGPALCPDTMLAYADSDEALSCLCPGEATLRGSVWGTDIYTADSGTCRAAVHAGVIGLTGGTVSLQMLPGQPRYVGTTRNGLASSNYNAYRASFRFEGGQRASAPVQAPVEESLRRTGQVQLYITFRVNSADLDIAAAPVLTELRDALMADPSLRLRLVGHTDSTGTRAVNAPLSQRRAESVRQWLVASGIAAGRLSAEGRGPDEPIADNATEAGRSLNRRVQAARAP